MGPFIPQSMPFSYKAGGFARGAGHGSTFQDNRRNYWHVSTIAISVKNNFERRIGIWPAGFDADGVLYCNTAFGDYPTYLPDKKEDHLESRFTGWMLQRPCSLKIQPFPGLFFTARPDGVSSRKSFLSSTTDMCKYWAMRSISTGFGKMPPWPWQHSPHC